MADVVFILALVAAFAIASAYVTVCERIVGDERSDVTQDPAQRSEVEAP